MHRSGQTTKSLPEKGEEHIPARPGAAGAIGVVRTVGSGAGARGQLGRTLALQAIAKEGCRRGQAQMWF